MAFVIQSKIDDEWHDTFRWMLPFDCRIDAEIELEELLDQSNVEYRESENYRILEVL